jgi:hypothetical protein
MTMAEDQGGGDGAASSGSTSSTRGGTRSADGDDQRLDLILSEALRALAHQQGLLDNVRSRATILTGSAALVASLLGAPVLQRDELGGPTVVALVALAGVLACTIAICVPWWRWYFRSSATVLLSAMDAGHSLNSMRRHLSVNLESWVDRNDRTMRVMQWLFTAGLVLLCVEVTSWAVELIRTDPR